MQIRGKGKRFAAVMEKKELIPSLKHVEWAHDNLGSAISMADIEARTYEDWLSHKPKCNAVCYHYVIAVKGRMPPALSAALIKQGVHPAEP
jgi:transketolase N-terminal domain/subunit